MPFVETDDAVKLFYEETGDGFPVVFIHEFAGDYRSWEAQVRHFSRRYRCITYNARGFPPSDVPDDLSQYGQMRARDDIKVILDHLDIGAAHIVGLSMGGFAALHFGLAYPQMARVQMRAIAEQLRERWPVRKLAIVHRLGTLAIGEASILIALTLAHREEGFEALRHAIDTFKETVPIWKKEVFADGEAQWVEGS